MTFPQLSPSHKYAINACKEGLNNEDGVHSAGAHDPDHSDVRGVLKTGNPCGVGRCIAAPVAEEAQYLRLKCFFLAHSSIAGRFSAGH